MSQEANGRRSPTPARVLGVRHLELVEAIHRLGTVTAAARSLHMSQPAASHALAKLEDRLEVALFDRTPEGMSITPEGRRVLEASGRVLRELERAEYDLRQLAGGVRGVLRLSTECYTAYYWLPEVIRRMQQDFPDVELRLQPEATYRVVEAFRAGELDLALMCCPPPDDEYVALPILRDELVIVVPPGHAWAGRSHVEALDFATQTLIIHTDEAHSTLISDVLTPAGVRPMRVLELRLTEVVIAAVRGHLGVGVVARWAAAREIESGALVAVRITSDGLRRIWHAVVRRDRAELPHVVRLLELLERHALRGTPGSRQSSTAGSRQSAIVLPTPPA